MTLKVPAPFSSDLTEKIQKMAIDAFKLFRCAGLARVDFFVEKTTEKLFVNELNTIPGFTATSVYAVLWEHSGLTYDALLTELINLAMQPNVRG
jgi:D-alanine-D-alanine ligase